MNRVKMVCSECGSEEVLKDAFSSWDETGQDWVLSNVFDKGAYCESCDGPCSIEEVKIEANEKPEEARPFSVIIRWGIEADGEQPDNTYTFDSKEEYDGFMRALDEHDGWYGHTIIEESEGRKELDVAIIEVATLEPEFAKKFCMPWALQWPDGATKEFPSEEAACRAQREHRKGVGLGPMSGEAL